MPRSPKPWYWKARKGWYVTIDGTRHRLADTRKDAQQRFHELMAKPQRRQVSCDAVVGVIDLFLEWVRLERKPETFEWYRQRLQRFSEAIGKRLPVQELRPFHVQQFIDAMAHSSGTKRNYVRAVKRAMAWAREQGYIDENPIATMRKPKAGKREMVLREAEFQEMLSFAPDASFRDLCIVTYRTGCRPQESLRVEARHVDLGNARWVFPETEEKNESIYRVVYLTEEALQITRRLMALYPTGKLFRNSEGKPWSTDACNCAFIRIQTRMGKAVMKRDNVKLAEKDIKRVMKEVPREKTVGGERVAKKPWEIRQEARRRLIAKRASALAPKYSLYALRHSWATLALERGVDPLTVAVLLGHRDPSTLSRVYQHVSLNPQHMLQQARKAAG